MLWDKCYSFQMKNLKSGGSRSVSGRAGSGTHIPQLFSQWIFHYTGYSTENYGRKSNTQRKPLPQGEGIGSRVVVAESLKFPLYLLREMELV